jgi:exosortase A
MHRSENSRPWRDLFPALGLAALVLGAVFWREIAGAGRVWLSSPTYNHCFLVLPIALYMIWDRRRFLAGEIPRPDFRALALLPILSLAWILMAVLGVLEFQQFVFVTMVQAILFACLGGRVYRLMLGPLLYLYLLVPSGEFLVPHLQDLTAGFAVRLLQLFHVPVYSDGIIISIPEGDFIVAEACAGLRFLIASIAFGVFFALMVYRRWWKRLAFILVSLAVPILANGLRAFGIIYLAHLTNNVTAVEADHIIYGWGFFTAVLLLQIALGMRYAEKQIAAPHAAPRLDPPPSRKSPWVAVALALVLVALGPVYLARLDQPARMLDLANAEPPQVAPPWRAKSGAPDDWQPVIVDPDREFRDGFTAAGNSVERYVALYDVYGRHNNLVRSQNRVTDDETWVRSTLGATDVDIPCYPPKLASAEIHSGNRTRLVWYFYVVDGAVTSSGLDAKLRLARDVILGRPSVAAFVAVAAPRQDDNNPPERVLADFLRAMPLLPAYVEGMTQPAGGTPPAVF